MDQTAGTFSVGEPSGSSSAPFVLAENKEWMVLHKPAGWHSVEVRSSSGGEVLSRWIAVQFAAQARLPDAGLVHRLDQCTSGCMIAARDASVHGMLREAVSGRGSMHIKKVYLALVRPGIAPQGRFELVFSSRHKGSTKATVRRDGEGELGECSWRVVRAAGKTGNDGIDAASTPLAFDLIEVEIHGPGRRHQIRAGMAFTGHPLAGDALYRGAPLNPKWSTGCFTLHAWRLEIGDLVVESPRPTWAIV